MHLFESNAAIGIARFVFRAIALILAWIGIAAAYPQLPPHLPLLSPGQFAPHARTQHVTLGTLDEAPLASFGRGDNAIDPFTRYLQAIERRSRLRFELRRYATLDELEQALGAGEVDLAGPLKHALDPEADLAFTKPLVHLPIAIVAGPFVRPGPVVADELISARVAVLQSGQVCRHLQRHWPAPRYVPMQSEEALREALDAGSVDYALLEQSRAKRLLERSSARVAGHLPFLYEARLAVAAHRADLLFEVERAIDEIPAAERESLRRAWLAPEAPRRKPSAWLAASLLALPLLAASMTIVKRTRGREADVREPGAAPIPDVHAKLPNREAMLLHVQESVERAERRDEAFSLLLLDIDNFKAFNDAFGERAGDALLSIVASRTAAVARGCWLGRCCGDAFALVFPQAAIPRLSVLACDVLAGNAGPAKVGGEDVYATVSIGIARYPIDAREGDRLVAAAEIALDAAKKAGKNTWRCYEADMGRRAALRARSLQSLRRIFERDGFLLHYQPKVSLATGRTTGYEALLRWNGPNGVESAGELVATAEQCGFIETLGEWVVRSAARQSLAWRQAGLEASIAVNVSALQLRHPGLARALQEMVDADPALPRCLVLELTESALAEEREKMSESMRAIAAMGFAFHIDDFGTGYSSLSRLSRLPVSTLKIDRSFIEGVPKDEEACAVVHGILALARAMRVRVVAEGVETQEQADCLRAAGCDEAQGYHFGRPAAPIVVDARTHSNSSAGQNSPAG
jgi:diguanylate cyclase (GGDEF)-like protein